MAAIAYPRVVVPVRPPVRPVPVRRRPAAPAQGPSTPVASRRTRPSPVTFRRRRLAALAGCVAMVPAAHLCAALLGGGPLTAPEGPSRDVAAHVYVVQPGDTLWSISSRLRPGADPRPLVQALTDGLGAAGLQPGQSLQLP